MRNEPDFPLIEWHSDDIKSQIYIADLAPMEGLEAVFLSNRTVSCYNIHENPIELWKTTIHIFNQMKPCGLVLGDFSAGDYGRLEIAILTPYYGESSDQPDHHLYVLDGESGFELLHVNYPYVSSTNLTGVSPNSVDLDQDGVDEIVFVDYYTLRALNIDGSSVNGFPIDLQGRYSENSCVAIGDIDCDYLPEIVIRQSQRLSIWNHDGSEQFVNNPTLYVSTYYAPVLFDSDSDGYCEIWVTDNDKLKKFSFNGNSWDGTIIMDCEGEIRSPVSVADLDYNNSYTLVFTVASIPSTLTAVYSNGEIRWQREVALMATNRDVPLISDLNGDAYPEILFEGSSIGDDRLHVVDRDGNLAWSGSDTTWVVGTKFSKTRRLYSVIKDFDGDGKNEILSPCEQWVFAWESDGIPTTKAPDWSQYGADNFNSGRLYQPITPGTITSNITWRGSAALYGDVTIAEGATLTILPGTKVYFIDGAGLWINGTLKVYGQDYDSVYFLPTNFNPSPGCWDGIRINSGGEAYLKNANIKYGVYGLFSNDADIVHIENSRISNNELAGVGFWDANSNCYIKDSELISNGDYGIGLHNGSPIAEKNTVRGASYGIFYHGNGSPQIRYNTIYDPSPTSFHGITAKHYGATDNVSPIIEGNIIYGGFGQAGIYLWKATDEAEVKLGNKVTGAHGYGLMLRNSDASVFGIGGSQPGQYNSFIGSETGIYITENSDPEIRWNQLLNHDAYAVYISSGCNPNLGTSAQDRGYNSFVKIDGIDPSYRDIYSANLIQQILAQGNWWGEDPPDENQIEGDIDYSNWLGSSPFAGQPRLASDNPNIPRSYALRQNYPNPFNSTTIIEYDLPKTSNVNISVYNILGQRVKSLVNKTMEPGSYRLMWDGRNNNGKQISSGVYFYLFKANEYQSIKKLTILK